MLIFSTKNMEDSYFLLCNLIRVTTNHGDAIVESSLVSQVSDVPIPRVTLRLQ